MASPPLVPGGSRYGIPMFPQGDLVVAVYLAGTSGDRLEMGKVPGPRGCSNNYFWFSSRNISTEVNSYHTWTVNKSVVKYNHHKSNILKFELAP